MSHDYKNILVILAQCLNIDYGQSHPSLCGE
jgi:hypothetical protein